MAEPAAVASTHAARRIDPFAFAPGLALNGATVLLFAVALWRGSERTGDLGTIALVAIAWAGLLLIWSYRVFRALADETLRRSDTGRWALAPFLFLVAGVVVFSGAALVGRMALSVGALDAAADAALSGRAVAPGWIGLYPVEAVSVDGQAVRFEIIDQNALVRDPPPEEPSPVITYEPVLGRWSIEHWSVVRAD